MTRPIKDPSAGSLLRSRILEKDLNDRNFVVGDCQVQRALVELVHGQDVGFVGDQQLQGKNQTYIRRKKKNI